MTVSPVPFSAGPLTTGPAAVTGAPPFWRAACIVPAAAVELYADALSDGAVAVSTFEQDDDGILWLVEATWLVQPPRGELSAKVAILAEAVGIPEPELLVEPLPHLDWVERVYRGFPPILAGRFFIHGSHHTAPPPASSLPMCVDAATAFGTGEHASTFGCLLALDRLGRRWPRRVLAARRPLDMGTGTGILAMAVARLWRVPVLAVDLDGEAVRVARENVRTNRLAHLVQTDIGDGYRAGPGLRHRPCRLIIANILARPLTHMAPALARRLQPGGRAILAGLLARQAPLVLQAHRAHGLVLEHRMILGDWCTLVLRRPGGRGGR